MSSRPALSLYRSFLRAGKSYPDYNIRNYILRRAKTEFRKNAALNGAAAETMLQDARDQLALVKRQSIIAGFYKTEKSVMETELKVKAVQPGAGAGKV